MLTVLTDTNAPFAISAVANRNLTNIVVSFSEAVAASSATGLANYFIFQNSAPTNILAIQRATIQSGLNVTLTTTPRIAGLNYSLLVSGVTDVSSVSNMIAPNSRAPLAYGTDLIGFDAATSWRFYPSG